VRIPGDLVGIHCEDEGDFVFEAFVFGGHGVVWGRLRWW
jgi:hypothetical protein